MPQARAVPTEDGWQSGSYPETAVGEIGWLLAAPCDDGMRWWPTGVSFDEHARSCLSAGSRPSSNNSLGPLSALVEMVDEHNVSVVFVHLGVKHVTVVGGNGHALCEVFVRSEDFPRVPGGEIIKADASRVVMGAEVDSVWHHLPLQGNGRADGQRLRSRENRSTFHRATRMDGSPRGHWFSICVVHDRRDPRCTRQSGRWALSCRTQFSANQATSGGNRRVLPAKSVADCCHGCRPPKRSRFPSERYRTPHDCHPANIGCCFVDAWRYTSAPLELRDVAGLFSRCCCGCRTRCTPIFA